MMSLRQTSTSGRRRECWPGNGCLRSGDSRRSSDTRKAWMWQRKWSLRSRQSSQTVACSTRRTRWPGSRGRWWTRSEPLSSKRSPRHHQAYETEWQRLEGTESWRTIQQEDRNAILARLRIETTSKGAIGTEQEVLESVDRISLDDWRTRTAALPQWFADARAEADRLVEPKTRHLKLESTTLRTPEDVKMWTKQTEQRLLEAVKHGPIVVD